MSRQPKIHRLTRRVAGPYDPAGRFLERLRNHTQHCKCPTCSKCGMAAGHPRYDSASEVLRFSCICGYTWTLDGAAAEVR